jgi:hypothetical protein
MNCDDVSEALVALAYGETPSGINAAVAERHLASCPQCAAELELARMSRRLEEDERVALFPAASGTPLRKTGETDRRYRFWRATALAASAAGVALLTGLLFEAQQAGQLSMQLAQKPAPSQPAQAAPSPQPGPTPPVAASPGGTDPQAAELRQQMETARRQQQAMEETLNRAQAKVADLRREALGPQINVRSLASPEVVRDGGGQETKEIVFRSVQPVQLALSTTSEKAVREMDVLDGGGKVLFTRKGLIEDRGEYSVGFPAGSLEPGRYTIQLFETANGKREAREKYALRVQ